MEKAKFSVLMSVYQEEQPEFLRQSLESIVSQTVPPSELIVVEDGPLTESLLGVLDCFEQRFPSLRRIRLEQNQGLGAALNAGLSVCSYPLVARMDSDDIAVPDRFALQLKAFEQRPEMAVLGGQIAEFSEDPARPERERHVPLKKGEIYRYIKKRNPMNHMTVMFRKDVVQKAGGYRPFPLFEDYDLWARLCAMGAGLYNLPQVLVLARAGNRMVARRGGASYAKQQRAFQRSLLRLGLISPFQYCLNCCVRTVVSVMPQHMRAWFYNCILRRK